jgi:hypothetical protein
VGKHPLPSAPGRDGAGPGDLGAVRPPVRPADPVLRTHPVRGRSGVGVLPGSRSRPGARGRDGPQLPLLSGRRPADRYRPQPGHLEVARRRTEKLGRSVDLRVGDAQSLDFEDGTFDTVVSTLTMCSVPDHHRALSEAARVLRPGGRPIMLEHVRSPSATVIRVANEEPNTSAKSIFCSRINVLRPVRCRSVCCSSHTSSGGNRGAVAGLYPWMAEIRRA